MHILQNEVKPNESCGILAGVPQLFQRGIHMIIDFHTHVFPDEMAERTIAKLSGVSHIRPYSDGTAGGLLASMKRAGVDCSVVLPVATNPRQVERINDASAAMNADYGAQGLCSFGCIHPDHPAPKAEIQRIAQLGLKGIKLHPVYQGVDLDDPRCLRILEAAGEQGLIVVTHGGIDIGYPKPQHAAPEKLLRAMRQVGPVTVVAAHMGGWKQWEQAEELLADTSVYLDTSFSTGSITPLDDGFYRPEELPLLRQERFVQMVRAFGAGRILFGTDSPWTGQEESIRQLKELPLTAEEQAAILGGNAAVLLHDN